MLDKKSRRVVIINNIQSETIDQAIFILKSDKSELHNLKSDTNIATEAQSIINNYIRQVEHMKEPGRGQKRIRHKMSAWGKTVLFSALITIFCIIYFKIL